ncbi:TPA: hypothetical protein N1999_002142 [Pseudomonas aeruginosa]|nr:hypothetical protein [Pseudomonas aeruginosa]
MSEVKRFDFDVTGCQVEDPLGGYVDHDDYAKLAAEAQALREEVERGNRITVAMALDISAVGVALGIPGEEQEGGTGEFIDLIRELQKEVEALRARGLTVSEGLVQGVAKFAREIICGALEGGSFDGADIQESAERHGLIAKQVMNEPCRGPEEYCACAWSTSFPAECYRVTPELRALLSEQA